MTSFCKGRSVYVNSFKIVRPQFESAQSEGFDWLQRAHLRAEESLQSKSGDESKKLTPQDLKNFARGIDVGLRRFGCSPTKIARRGHDLEDFKKTEWEDMRIFRLHEEPCGKEIQMRMEFFRDRADEIMAEFYPMNSGAPDLMVHVSCTGYMSPNPTQRLISLRGWGGQTESTQVNHMGCYAAVPALRIAGLGVASGSYETVDIVHNEMCTLHFDPSKHEPEQLVVQSLFADGHIAYRVSEEPCSSPGFKLLSLREEIIPDSLGSMTWALASHGFKMTLAREVPAQVAEAVPAFVHRLYSDAGRDAEKDLPRSVAALHPGGPRIIDGLKEVLKLSEEAVQDSRRILLECGNMSSATLPHIFESVANRQDVPAGTLVMGLAFGPGLTMVGALLEKVS